jgi:hypothetical protein
MKMEVIPFPVFVSSTSIDTRRNAGMQLKSRIERGDTQGVAKEWKEGKVEGSKLG